MIKEKDEGKDSNEEDWGAPNGERRCHDELRPDVDVWNAEEMTRSLSICKTSKLEVIGENISLEPSVEEGK